VDVMELVREGGGDSREEEEEGEEEVPPAKAMQLASPPSTNGLTANGLTANGLTARRLTANGLTANGLTANGLDSNVLQVPPLFVLLSQRLSFTRRPFVHVCVWCAWLTRLDTALLFHPRGRTPTRVCNFQGPWREPGVVRRRRDERHQAREHPSLWVQLGGRVV